MNTNDKPLRLAVISDIHLGSKRNSTEKIIANLNKYINVSSFLVTIDILFIAGDLFDEMLFLAADDVDLITIWIAKLLRNCAKHNVILRVLEGTPSHDRGQSKAFNTAYHISVKAGMREVNMKYINTLSIEYIPGLGINVLYVPDEWGPTSEDTLDQVKALLRNNNLKKVDYAIMHGLFDYQLPSHIPHIPRHNEIEYSKLVKRLIFIGHIHTFSTSGKVIAQGSFDRLSHNEEEPKGFVRAVVQPNGEYEMKFIENKSAATYLTITCSEPEVTDSLLWIDSKISKLEAGSNIRIEAHYTNAILSNMSVVKERWPLFNWTSIARGKEKKESEVVMDHKNVYVPILLDRQNLARVVLDRLHPIGLSEVVLEHCRAHLAEVTGA